MLASCWPQTPHLILLDDGFYERKIRPVATKLTIFWLQHENFDHSILVSKRTPRAPADGA